MRTRLRIFAIAAAGFAALLGWAVAGLPAFGHYGHAYGLLLDAVAPRERHVTNIVTSIVFDYRGLDTMGEEFILFGTVFGVVLILRDTGAAERTHDAVRSDGVRLLGTALVPLVAVLGLAVLAHGYLTPGGGFQAGVLLAGALLLVYLTGSYRGYRRVSPVPLLDGAEASGGGGFVAVGIAMLVAGGAFLENELPLGTTGTLASAGSIALLNVAAGLEVAAASALLLTEFLEEIEARRRP